MLDSVPRVYCIVWLCRTEKHNKAKEQRTMTNSETKLIQFQCQRQGEIFYYQHTRQAARSIVSHCPVCGSKRVNETGRDFPAVDEAQPFAIDINTWE